MKLGRIAVVLATLIASTTSFAGVISASSNINFLVFDGQKVKKSTKLETVVGKSHQVVLEVSSIYRAGGDDSFFESDPIVLSFNGSTENIVIKAPKLTSEADISKFKQSPTFKVETTSGNALSFKQDYLKGSDGFLPNSNIMENLAAYNAENNKAAVKEFAIASPSVAVAGSGSKTNKSKVMVQGENIAEQQLQYWFQQADKETQQRFLDWAKKQ